MNKLTAEKCRELLEEIKYNRENCFLSEKTKMLMGIAESVILEQQERGEGWIEWGGGECPADEDAIVEMKWKYGDQITNRAGIYQWSYYEYGDRIIAYRIIDTNRNGEQ